MPPFPPGVSPKRGERRGAHCAGGDLRVLPPGQRVRTNPSSKGCRYALSGLDGGFQCCGAMPAWEEEGSERSNTGNNHGGDTEGQRGDKGWGLRAGDTWGERWEHTGVRATQSRRRWEGWGKRGGMGEEEGRSKWGRRGGAGGNGRPQKGNERERVRREEGGKMERRTKGRVVQRWCEE